MVVPQLQQHGRWDQVDQGEQIWQVEQRQKEVSCATGVCMVQCK